MPGKSELADRIAARGWSRTAASSAVDAVLDEITAALAGGERVTLTGFGTFESAPRAARTARNPQTGAAIDVAATTVARFHPGATLRSRVASGTTVALAALSDSPVGSLAPTGTAAAAEVTAPVATKASPAKKAAAPTKAELKAADRAEADAKKAAAKTSADAKTSGAKKAERAKADAKKKATKAKAETKHGTKHKKK